MPDIKLDWTIPVPLLLTLAAGAITGTVYIAEVSALAKANAAKITEVSAEHDRDFSGVDTRQRAILEKVTRIDANQSSLQSSISRLARALGSVE